MENENKELKFVALGVYQDPKNGVYYVAEVKYDPITKEAKVVNAVEAGPGKGYSNEKFRLMAVEHNLV